MLCRDAMCLPSAGAPASMTLDTEGGPAIVEASVVAYTCMVISPVGSVKGKCLRNTNDT